MSNKSAYKKFMSKKIEVNLDEDTVIILHKPRGSKATIDLRAYMDSLSSGNDAEDEKDNTRMLKVAARALGHCMPANEEWDEEELIDLVVAGGGEVGDLSMRAMGLCGMPTDQISMALDNIGEDPSLLPGGTG